MCFCCGHPQDKRLRSGDQILRIGDTDLAGMNSEQVAQVKYHLVTEIRLEVEVLFSVVV